MAIIGERGLIFSLDLAVAVMVMFAIAFLILLHSASLIENNASLQNRLSLERKAIYLADSLVKNRSPENPLLGSASYNPLLKRVETNKIDYSLLKSISDKNFGLNGISISLLEIEYKNREKEKIIENPLSGECISVERFVLMQKILPEKALLRLVVCDASLN
ncbi:MAG: hypothetical protein ABID38_01020 [Candidatus Diapherotrites archaeon]